MKDAHWFRHDTNASADPKIMRLIAKYGWAGYGLWWRLIEHMRSSDGGRLLMSDVDALADGLRAPELPAILEDCCKWELLHRADDCMTSDRLEREIEAYHHRREAQRERQNKRRGKMSRAVTRSHAQNSDVSQESTESTERTKKTKREYAPSVYMTEEEYQKLVESYGKRGATACIEKLANYKLSKGKTYKDDYRAILTWVIDALKLTKAPPSSVVRCPVCGTEPAGTESFCRSCGLDRSDWKDVKVVAEARTRWQQRQS